MGGMNGGFRTVKMSEVRSHWRELKENLLETLKEDLDDEYTNVIYEKVNKFPPTIGWQITDKDIVKMFSIFKHCDCPALIGNCLFLGEGDNVSYPMFVLSDSIKHVIESSQYFETWT